MKRIAALLLAALLALTAVSAFAEDYTLEEKFYQQAFKESAYRGTVTFAVSGTGTKAMDAMTWAALKALAPRLSLSLEHATTAGKDEGQGTLTLTLDGKTSAKTTVMYDEKLVAFASTLLGGEKVYYSADRNWNLSALLENLIQRDSQWPPIARLIAAIQTAPEEWQNRAKERIALYETKLGLWLNGYASFSTGRENNVAYSELSCVIPAQSVKAEIKQLMVDLYGDSALLSLLREIATPQEAAAYLQPSMMNTLFGMLDNVKLEGEVKVVRRYDAMGDALLDQISLPFAENSVVRSLTVAVTPAEGGQNIALQGALNNGTEFDISCLASNDMIYTGSVTLVLPETESTGFVVNETANDLTLISFDYNLIWEPGKDEYTLATDRFNRTIKGSVVIRPRKEGVSSAIQQSFPEQSLTLEAAMSSGSSKRSATQLNGTLTWRDLDSGASISAILTSRTVSPFGYSTPSSLTGALRIDLMTDASRAALVQGWTETAAAYLSQLLLGGTGFTVLPK